MHALLLFESCSCYFVSCLCLCKHASFLCLMVVSVVRFLISLLVSLCVCLVSVLGFVLFVGLCVFFHVPFLLVFGLF